MKRTTIILFTLAVAAIAAWHVWAYMQPDPGGVPAPVSAPGIVKGQR